MTSPRKERGPRQVYANDAIEVHWEPKLCIHSRSCVQRLGQVFDPERRPWIDVDGADPDAIAATVLTCPTGALHFRRLDGGVQEHPAEDLQALLAREDTRAALCRCGASGNKPFCDGSHRRVGFSTRGEAD